MPEIPYIKQFLRFEADFMGYLMAMTQDFDAAEEVFQNAAVVVMEKAAGQEIRDFRAWAKEVVRRQALVHLRKQGRSRPMDPHLIEQITQSFMEDASSNQRRKDELSALQQCIEKLRADHRNMVAMRYEQRQSFARIAAAVGRTAAAVQRTISRTRQALHDCVQGELTEPKPAVEGQSP